MGPLHKSDNASPITDANDQKKDRNGRNRTRRRIRPLGGGLSVFLTARIISISATLAVAITLITIVTVTGITQKRGSDGQAAASNGAKPPDSGSGTNSSIPAQPVGSPQDRPVPNVGRTVVPTRMNRDLRELPPVPSANPPGFELPELHRHPRPETDESSEEQAPVPQFDTLRQALLPQLSMPALNLSFEGQDLTASGCNCSPPDTDGDVGSNHFIQMVNSGAFKVWDKSGTTLLATTTLTTLWGTGGSNPCTQGKHFGDGVAFYDHLADRWVLTDFAFGTSGPNTVPPYYQCTAVSQTSDPVSGGWYFYAVQHDSTNTDWLGDYPKFGIWPDAYYSAYNMFCGAASCTFGGRNSFQGVQVVAYERTKMIAGQAMTPIFFRRTPAQVGDSYSFLPATYRFGDPPSGRNEFFASIDSPATANWNLTLTKVHIWKFHVDFTTPTNSSFSGPEDVIVNGFTDAWDSTENGAIVPQSGTSGKLDTVGDRLFANLWYQNLGGTESLWATHTINDTNVVPTAVRWYQLNVTGNTVATTPVQQGDINGGSDGLYRWMPSLAVDASGNMAIGYSVSSSGMFPSIRYNGRLTTDTVNTLGQGETTMVSGTGAFTGSTRWGDYSATGIDPSDGCTFWHTNEYMLSGSTSNWKTRVGSFTYPACVAANDGTLTGTVTDSVTSAPISGVTVTIGSKGRATTNGSGVYSINILPRTFNLTATKTGYTSGSANGVVVTQGNTTIQNFSLTSSCSPVARTWIGAGAGGVGTDFNTATNWSPNGVPQPCDNLTISTTSGATILVSSNITVNSITMSNGTTGPGGALVLDVQTNTLTVLTSLTGNNAPGASNGNNLILRVGNSPGSMRINGAINLGTSANNSSQTGFQGSAGANSTGTFVFGGDLTFGASLVTYSAGLYGGFVFDGTGTQTISLAASLQISGNMTLGSTNSPTVILSAANAGTLFLRSAADSLTINAGSTLDLTTRTLNKLAAGGTLTLANGATLKLAASTGGQTGSNFPSNYTTYTLNANSTVDYDAAGGTNQTIYASVTYGNLTISRASGVTATTKTAGAALTVVNNLTINSGATFAASTFTHNIGGNWQNNGTFTASTSTINFNTSAVPKTISGTSTTAFNNLTVNKGTDTASVLEATGPMTMSGNLTLTNGLFKLTDPGAVAQFTAGPTIPSTAGIWINGGTVSGGAFSYTNNGFIRITSGNATFGTGSGNSITNQTGSTFDVQGGTVNVGGRLQNSGGTFLMSGGQLTVCTAGNASSTIGTFEMSATANITMSSGTVIFQNATSAAGGDLKILSGAGTKSIAGGTFQIGNGSTPALQTFKLNSAVPISNLTINSTNSPTGRLDTSALTVSGNVTISGGTLDAAANNLNMTVGGNWSNNGGAFSPGSATVTFNSTTSGQTIGGSAATQTFNGIAVSKSGQTLSVGGSTTTLGLTGTLTLNAGTLNAGTAANINVGGDWTNNGGSFTPGSGTVTFNSTTAAQAINGSATSQTFNKITVNKTGQILSIAGSATALNISDTLTVSAGTLDQGSTANVTGATFSVSTGATLRNLGTGDMTIGAGGVTNNGTVTFDGGGGGCGSADSILIRSSSSGVQRSWSGTGTFSMSDVDVQDQAGTAIVTVSSGTNSGNNGATWVFIDSCNGATGKTYVWTGPTLTDNSWTTPTNWKVANSNPAQPRASTAGTDVMIIDGSNTPSPVVTGIPTQTVAAFKVINNAFPSLSTSAASTLTVDPGAGGLGFDVGYLSITGSNALTIKLATGTGRVTGIMTVGGGGHRLISNNAGAITFPNGSNFTTDTGFTGNAFGTGAANDGAAGSVVFQSGASYNHNAGESPFGASGNPSVVTFQTGSYAAYYTATGFDASGRTYATLQIGKGDPGGIVVNASQTGTGNGNFQFDNLVINSTSTTSSSLNYTGSGSSAIIIQGNITSLGAGSGSLPDVILTAGSGGISINKPGGGAVTFGNTNNRAVRLDSDTTLDSGTTLNLGRPVQMGLGANRVLTANGPLTPNYLGTGYVLGAIRKPSVPVGSYTFPVGTAIGYTPVDLTNATGAGDLTVLPKPSVQSLLSLSTSLKEYWTLTLNSGSLTTDLTFNYLPADVTGTEANYRVIRVESGTAVSFENNCPSPAAGYACVDSTNHRATVPGVSAFSDWTVGEPAAPTAVKLSRFTATRDDEGVTLQWRTGFEARNLGYNVYREQDGQRVAITPSLIAGSALMTGSHTVMNAGHSYTWYDRAPNPATSGVAGSAAYWLEDIDVDGTRTLHGPIAPSLDQSSRQKDRQSETFADLQRRTAPSGSLFSNWPAAFADQHAKLLLAPKPASKPNLTQHDIAGRPGLKIAVTQSGWYRVTLAELLAAGFDPRGQVTQMQLYANASEVPIKLSGNGTLATNSDYFEFYGHGLNSPTDAAQTYYLLIGNAGGKRISLSSGGKPGDPSGPTSFDYTLERKDRLIYYAGLLNGDAENMFGGLVRESLAAETLSIAHLDTAAAANGAQATLEVSLVGVTKQAHSVLLSLNGQDVGTVDFSDNENPTKSFSVAASLLTDGDNIVRLTALNGNLDISLIDTVRLTYPHLYAADNNALFISVDNSRTRRVSGFTDAYVRAIDVTNPGNIVELQPVVTSDGVGNYAADLQVPSASKRSAHSILVFADNTAQSVNRIKSNEPSSLWSHVTGDDYIIITSKELKPSVEPLAAFRRSQGLVVDVVDVEDLFDEFSYGQHSPAAIHDFLQTAVSTWQRKPRFVLLAGDSSLDPNNYLGQGIPDVVPTKLLDTTLMETASDDWLADFDNDAVADLAVGRLPANTTAAMDLIVAKIIAYENMPHDASRGVTLVADNTFESASDSVVPLLPPGVPVTIINRSSADDQTIHNEIVANLNQGPAVSNYFGHGNNDVWTGAPIFSADDAPGLTNQNHLTVFVMMTCFNGYFQDVFSESLSEALLKSPGGAISIWASSGMTEPPGQNQIDEALFRQLFSGTSPTMGDAVRAAKQATNDRDVRLTWILFGDPATRLR